MKFMFFFKDCDTSVGTTITVQQYFANCFTNSTPMQIAGWNSDVQANFTAQWHSNCFFVSYDKVIIAQPNSLLAITDCSRFCYAETTFNCTSYFFENGNCYLRALEPSYTNSSTIYIA